MKSWILFLVPACLFGQGFTTSPRLNYFEISVGQHELGTDSDIYRFNQENLLFDPSDLDGTDLALGMYWQRNNLLSFGLGFRFFEESVVTEDRLYTYADGTPVNQSINLKKNYFSYDMILTPFGSGERYGTRAWAPKSVVPYIRLGAGVLSWEYTESGDFVDYEQEEIFFDTYADSGTAFAAHLGLGLRVKLSPRLDLNLSGTLTAAKDSMSGGDFVGFDDLDLSSTAYNLGITLRFF